jgi:hypothetical protein
VPEDTTPGVPGAPVVDPEDLAERRACRAQFKALSWLDQARLLQTWVPVMPLTAAGARGRHRRCTRHLCFWSACRFAPADDWSSGA